MADPAAVRPKILVMHLGALGDFVLSWPALGVLAQSYSLHLWGNPAWARLILPNHRIFDRESARFAPLFVGGADANLTKWLTGHDYIALFAHKPPGELFEALQAKMPGRVWLIPTRPKDGQIRHAAQIQIDALTALGFTKQSAPLVPHLQPAKALSPVVAPGSGGREKRLPLPVLKSFCQTFCGRGRTPLIVFGPAEDEKYRRETTQLLDGLKVDYLTDVNINELATHLASAGPYLGADSGVSHLAGALGAKGWVVFGPSDPRIWAPWKSKLQIIKMHEMNQPHPMPWE